MEGLLDVKHKNTRKHTYARNVRVIFNYGSSVILSVSAVCSVMYDTFQHHWVDRKKTLKIVSTTTGINSSSFKEKTSTIKEVVQVNYSTASCFLRRRGKKTCD